MTVMVKQRQLTLSQPSLFIEGCLCQWKPSKCCFPIEYCPFEFPIAAPHTSMMP